MNAAHVCVIGLIGLVLGYFFYSRYIAFSVFGLEENEPVPSKELEDGVDFVPTARPVLFGHHYASIAGAAPIIGPAIAVVWGWAPALIWVVVGSVFMGAVHDFSTLVISVRNKGQSIGQISAKVIGPRTATLFLLVIFCLVMLVIAVFAKAIAGLFVKFPGTVLPINFEIIVALGIGWICYKRGGKLLWPSIAALLALYGMIFVGVENPLSLGSIVGDENQSIAWVVLLLIYSFIASVLPVWILLQPRDYINSHQLFVGLAALILGILVAQPEFSAPAFADPPSDAPPILPFLFVTIACGAISGFHGLVSSGTTSKQIACATDCRPIGYGAMLGEGLLALIATLAVSAGLADWAAHYDTFAHAAKGSIGAFVEGAAMFLGALGMPTAPAQVVIAVMVISFAATSLDTGVRIQRYILQELGERYSIPGLSNRYVAGIVAVVMPLGLCLGGQERALWPLFGVTNQLLAGLSLIVVTLWLKQSGRRYLPVAIPMVLVLVITTTALVSKLAQYLENGQHFLLGVGTLILALQFWVILEALMAARRGGPVGETVTS
ncbi:MAG: carbon starvation protein A [Polyangiaceae bacterium]|nr:carbon starvation protein A [Polyangiaceae bacterium]